MAKKKTTKKKVTKKKATKKKRSTKSSKSSTKENRGRPTLFTPEVREKIYENLHKLPFIKPAAANAGVSEAAVHSWLNQGVKDIEAARKTDFSIFSEKVTQLITQAEIDLFGVVKTEAYSNWQAARYLLQCLNARRYAQKAAIKVEEGEGDSAFEGDNIHAQLVTLINQHETEEV